jgi:hypothetical protein
MTPSATTAFQRTRCGLLALTLCFFPQPGACADWPHLRGGNYDGVSAEAGLAESWSANGPPRLWERELGQGYSGFVLAGGKLYTQRQALAGQFVVCLDPADGQVLWETRYDWAWQPKGAYPGPYATPTWRNGKVYFSSPSGLVGCMDAATGTTVWSVNVKEKFHGEGYGFGFAATPLVHDGKVIVPAGGAEAGLVALHADDGRTVWTAAHGPASYCGALPVRLQGREYIVGYLQNALVIVEASTGKVVARQALSNGYDEHSAWPLYREPHLLLTGPFRTAATRWRLQPAPDGSLLCRPDWTSRELSNDILSSVLYKDHVYGFDLRQLQASRHRASRGAFKCLDWSTGKVRWSTDRVGHASLVSADGKLLLFNDTGTLILARAGPAGYHELGRTQVFTDEMCWTPPLLSRSRLFLRSPSRAVCLYVGRPDEAPASTGVTPAPLRSSWRFDPAQLVTRERDYPNDAPSMEELSVWFAACVLLALASAALTGVAMFVAKFAGSRPSLAASLFWPAVFALGFLGPNLFSSWFDCLLFTWPACLYAAFHGVLLACTRAERQRADRRLRWTARLAIAAFVAVCYGYFELCKAGGMFVTWSFLIGFLPAFPFAFLSARAEMNGRRLPVRAAWMILAFGIFFWSFAGVMWWKQG